jgi:RNA polymerase sigma-70 factor, ECF subfamily
MLDASRPRANPTSSSTPSALALSPASDAAQARDDVLLERLARRDAAALDELYRVYSTPLFSFAMKVLGRSEDAEEVLQDTFVKIWNKAPTFDRTKSRPFTWAVMILRGLALDRRRKLHRRPAPLPLDAALEAPPPPGFPADESARLRAAFARLRVEERACLALAIFGERSHPEIAADLGQPLGTVKSRVRRALAKLREFLQSPP